MALDINLMGMGVSSHLAARTANGGTGPVNITAGASSGAATKITGTQFVTYISGPSGGGWVSMPAVGGSDNAATIADDFVMHNATASPVTVSIPTGVTVNIGSVSVTGQFTIPTIQTVTIWVVNTTQWFGLRSA